MQNDDFQVSSGFKLVRRHDALLLFGSFVRKSTCYGQIIISVTLSSVLPVRLLWSLVLKKRPHGATFYRTCSRRQLESPHPRLYLSADGKLKNLSYVDRHMLDRSAVVWLSFEFPRPTIHSSMRATTIALFLSPASFALNFDLSSRGPTPLSQCNDPVEYQQIREARTDASPLQWTPNTRALDLLCAPVEFDIPPHLSKPMHSFTQPQIFDSTLDLVKRGRPSVFFRDSYRLLFHKLTMVTDSPSANEAKQRLLSEVTRLTEKTLSSAAAVASSRGPLYIVCGCLVMAFKGLPMDPGQAIAAVRHVVAALLCVLVFVFFHVVFITASLTIAVTLKVVESGQRRPDRLIGG